MVSNLPEPVIVRSTCKPPINSEGLILCLLFCFVFRDDDEEDTAKGSASLFSFFAPKNADPKDKQHSFFEERHLKRVVSF